MSEQGLRPHLVHDIGAVDFDTDFADAGLVGNLLVHETVSDQLISSRSRGVSVSKLVRNCCHCSFLFAPDAIPCRVRVELNPAVPDRGTFAQEVERVQRNLQIGQAVVTKVLQSRPACPRSS
jgi:hypothetical protein